MEMTECRLCPRQCGVDRSKQTGYCGVSDRVKLARAALHFWEEPCISGERGSGTVFFSGCALKCVFCQNYQLSAGHFGKEVSIQRLAEIFLELQQQGAHNINLVTGGHYVPQIVQALELVRKDLKIPVVYNSSGYETVETLRQLKGYVDIYLPDLKYYSPERSARYSNARDYFAVASQAVQEMFSQVGPVQFDEQGMLQKGVVVRHMVMPNGVEDTMDILTWIAEHLPLDDILVSVMSQYTPFYKSADYSEINRRLTQEEYDRVLDWMECMGIEQGFVQELSSAKEEYTPDFSLQGV
ncbi:radical SAM protein [uncultured Negativibacillus sp.]|uniref:radical SAM protein n=1 Tax=uncultured Negativibacillus sp. TaxID=1980696 RepID=UPI0025D2CC6B|nr:radical SAM protein [uncultured Negativibacillus sp.]